MSSNKISEQDYITKFNKIFNDFKKNVFKTEEMKGKWYSKIKTKDEAIIVLAGLYALLKVTGDEQGNASAVDSKTYDHYKKLANHFKNNILSNKYK